MVVGASGSAFVQLVPCGLVSAEGYLGGIRRFETKAETIQICFLIGLT